MTRFTAAVIVLLLVIIGLLWLSAAAAQAPTVTVFTVIPTTDERVIVRWQASVSATVQRWRAGYAEPLPPISAPAELRATWIGGIASTPEAQSAPYPYPAPRPTLASEDWPELTQPALWFAAGAHELLWPPRVSSDWTQFHQAGDRYRLVTDGVALTDWTPATFRAWLPVMGG